MKTFLFKSLCLALVIFVWSCDDGDIITTSFNFGEETNLSLCRQDNVNVLYFIDPETNEAISFKFSANDFDGTFSGDIGQEVLEFDVDINATNQVVYRRLSGSANGSAYFCQQVPPSSPQVLEEFISTSGGTATFSIRISEQDDNDGVPAEIEDINGNGDFYDDDSDGDGIPDFLDTDDDNDNVLTSSERLEPTEEDENTVEVNGVLYVDTDGDGVANYLDADDDGDGVLTRNEDLNICEDPENPALNPGNDRNEQNLPHYLNQDVDDSVDVNIDNIVKTNTITRSFFTQVVFNDITFENVNNNESLSFTSFIMGRYTVNAIDQDLEFTDDALITEDEAENFCQ